MLITCPECSGKLSTAAFSCPHCGYSNKASPAAAATGAPPAAAPELVLPSAQAIRKVARRDWGDWIHSSVWRLCAGAAILLLALGLLALVFVLALKLNASRGGA